MVLNSGLYFVGTMVDWFLCLTFGLGRDKVLIYWKTDRDGNSDSEVIDIYKIAYCYILL